MERGAPEVRFWVTTMSRSSQFKGLHSVNLAPPKRSHTTLGALALGKLRALCRGLSAPELIEPATRVFHSIAAPWAEWALGSTPAWPNDLTDDGTPFEFS